jgi:tyrosine-specific transport protein
MKKHSKLLGGILLVSGTTIGAAMLALPISTGAAGFFPSLVILVAYWIFMTFTAFLILEVNLWMGPNTNLISMARQTLGKWGAAISWAIYLFLLYSLTTAYIAGSGSIISDIVYLLTGYPLVPVLGSVPLFLVFGFFVYKGTKSVDYINRLLMAALVITYVAMALFLTPHVNLKYLLHSDWKYLLMAVSIVATSFGFHIIIPSLTTYFDRDVGKLKKAILIGSAIPLAVYILWEFLALGIIPLEGPHGIIQGYIQGTNSAHLLAESLNNPSLSMLAWFFSLFAIVTSFLGVSLSLSDFLADGFKIQKNRPGRILLYLLTFVPPLLFTLTDPRAFLSALEYAGAFGVVTLLGLLPALMVWSGRYYKHFQSTFKAPGGKIALILAMFFSVLVIIIEIANKAGFITFLNQ